MRMTWIHPLPKIYPNSHSDWVNNQSDTPADRRPVWWGNESTGWDKARANAQLFASRRWKFRAWASPWGKIVVQQNWSFLDFWEIQASGPNLDDPGNMTEKNRHLWIRITSKISPCEAVGAYPNIGRPLETEVRLNLLASVTQRFFDGQTIYQWQIFGAIVVKILANGSEMTPIIYQYDIGMIYQFKAIRVPGW